MRQRRKHMTKAWEYTDIVTTLLVGTEQGKSASETAQELGRTTQAVYTLRSLYRKWQNDPQSVNSHLQEYFTRYQKGEYQQPQPVSETQKTAKSPSLTQENIFLILQSSRDQATKQDLARKFGKSENLIYALQRFYDTKLPQDKDYIRRQFGLGYLRIMERFAASHATPAASNAAAIASDATAAAINAIAQQPINKPEQVTANHPDRYEQLKQAQDQLDQTLITFIEQEVASRIKEKKQSLAEQLKARDTKIAEQEKTIARLNAEADKYQQAFVEARNSNWVSVLRKRFSGEVQHAK